VLDDSYKQRVKNLCDLIAKEQDQKRFSVLIHELNQLLDGVQASSPKEGDGRAGVTPSNPEQA
jgi:hypothetical protein